LDLGAGSRQLAIPEVRSERLQRPYGSLLAEGGRLQGNPSWIGHVRYGYFLADSGGSRQLTFNEVAYRSSQT
jgi:hypothetical protein